MTDWLPNPPDFRGELRAALKGPDRFDRLYALARYKLGLLEIIQIDRALGEVKPAERRDFSSVRLAVLASSTVDHLVPAIRVAALRRKLWLETYVGLYGQYRQQLLDTASSLHQFAPNIVLLSLTAREVIAGVSVTASPADVDAIIGGTIDQLRTLWRAARERLNATVIQQTYLDVSEPVFGSYDRLVASTQSRLIARLNDRMAEAAAADGTLLLDIARASERDGLDAWFDVTRWLQGKLEIAPQSAPKYGELLARIIAAGRGLSKKCLVLDLDNTLWGGVVGDDGLEGIVLGEGSGIGEAHLALQRYAKQLKERGVILAVCSKNDPEIAATVFREHPEMLLTPSDISVFVANWSDKASNLEAIAQQLNLGLDSLVFVDDNPAERARIRESLPMVEVPEMPGDAAQYVRCLADAGYFEAIAFTSDDRQRATQYAANASRQAVLDSSQTVDEFLRELKMSVMFGSIQAVDLARVAQLIGKTNQFNPTTRRHSAQDVGRYSTSGQHLTLQFRLVDKFGDNGLVSAMILRADTDETDIFEIDTWVMSCRVFGRQLEFEAMNIAVEEARRRGARAFRADYIPTPKNGVVRELYQTLGFTRAVNAPSASGATRWSLDLASYISHATHIARRSE